MNRFFKIKPVITEKSMQLAAKEQFTLFVPKDLDKIAIAKAIKNAFKVNVLSVNLLKKYPKPKQRGKITGSTKQLIKAIIKLKKGDKLPGFEIVNEDKNSQVDDQKQVTVKEKK